MQNKDLATSQKNGNQPHSRPGHNFPKGNKLGKQFKPGESGNPGGLSKLRCLTNELNRQLPGHAEKLIERAIRRALKNSRDLETIWGRAEGAVPKESDDKPTIQVVVVNGVIRPHASNSAT